MTKSTTERKIKRKKKKQIEKFVMTDPRDADLKNPFIAAGMIADFLDAYEDMTKAPPLTIKLMLHLAVTVMYNQMQLGR